LLGKSFNQSEGSEGSNRNFVTKGKLEVRILTLDSAAKPCIADAEIDLEDFDAPPEAKPTTGEATK